MYDILTLNKIAEAGAARLSGKIFNVSDKLENPDGILVRSADMLKYEFPPNLRAIARAGAGTNNIPVARCSEAGIVVFNTPGANANAVKELVIGALILSSRDIYGGIKWASALTDGELTIEKQVEKGKSSFTGPEIEGKNLGVIGLGAVGVKVANAAAYLGMNVYGYDPYISVDAAWSLKRQIIHATELRTIFENCDYITIHVPYMPETKHMIDAAAIRQMRQGVRIVNLARGELVCDDDILAGIDRGKIACYVTDFPNAKLVGKPCVLCIPHLGASTGESEENCAAMAADALADYLLNGNIKCSVNMPGVELDRSGKVRLCVIHRNVPNMLSGILGVTSELHLNIENMTNKSRGDYAYTIIDLNDTVRDEAVARLSAMENVLRVRVL